MWGFAWQNLVTRPSRTALAIIGLTIPILAFPGLFSISRGIRELVGGTLARNVCSVSTQHESVLESRSATSASRLSPAT